MDEFLIIRRYFSRDPGDSAVLLGVGDDGAVLRPDQDRHLVSVIDTLIAGVHFPENLGPDDIAYRAVAVNLSDMAAMGARPRWMKLALTLTEADESWLSEFANGLFQAADEHDVSLIGGDTTRGGQLVVTIEMLGDVLPGQALSRSGSAPGDQIYVTGFAGDAAAGLCLLQAESESDADVDYLTERFRRPTARIAFGNAIASSANAAIDTSDGLLGDLGKMLDASGVGATIDLESIPVSGALQRCFAEAEVLKFSLTGGDDYELCFASTEEPTGIGEQLGVPVTRIGEVRSEPGLRCGLTGRAVSYDTSGYRHFGERQPDGQI